MRMAALISVGFFCFASYPLPALAVPSAAGRAEASSLPNIVDVDRRCGPGRHWVHRYRNKRGHWVRAHCARNRHHQRRPSVNSLQPLIMARRQLRWSVRAEFRPSPVTTGCPSSFILATSKNRSAMSRPAIVSGHPIPAAIKDQRHILSLCCFAYSHAENGAVAVAAGSAPSTGTMNGSSPKC